MMIVTAASAGDKPLESRIGGTRYYQRLVTEGANQAY